MFTFQLISKKDELCWQRLMAIYGDEFKRSNLATLVCITALVAFAMESRQLDREGRNIIFKHSL